MTKNKSCIDKVVVLLKLLYYPIRLKISCDLILDEKCVSDPCKASLISQSAFSQHFTLLKKNRLLVLEKKALTFFIQLKLWKQNQLSKLFINISVDRI